MAIALEYQSVYCPSHVAKQSLRWHVIAATVLLISLATKIWVKLEITDVSYRLSAEKSRTLALDMTIRELELQQSVLLREDVLARRASSQLGLVQPQSHQFLRLGNF